MAEPLWRPSETRVAQTNMVRFIERVGADWQVGLTGFADLHRWSVEEPEKFWKSVARFAAIAAETWGNRVLADGDRMPGVRFFPDARLNFAENLLRRRDDGWTAP